MKKSTLLISLLLCFSLIKSQVPYEYLNINDINARVNAHPCLFYDLDGNSDYSFYESSLLMTTVFSHGLWIGGKDASGDLHIAASRYGDNGQDFFPGPIANNYNTAYDLKYNRLWKIDQCDIVNHMNNYNEPAYTMPEVISNWPAHGNTNNGEAHYLAPFVDVNNNWYYDPQNGDYPYINGYQAIYLILNDSRSTHGETNGEKLGIELHIMIYGYNDANYIIDKTVFVSYKIYNRSNNNYHDVYLGAFTDIDIGDGSDDYIGCDSAKNFYYMYNSNEYDKNSDRTSQGVYFLNKPMSKFIYFNNSSGSTGDPTTPIEYYYYLKGKWKDGSPLTYGGDGFCDSIPVDYAFPGNPNDTAVSWNEPDWGNIGGDRRGLGIYGPFDFSQEEEQCLVLAFVHATSPYGNYESINDLKFYETHLSSVFTNLNLDCDYWSGIKTYTKDDNCFTVYPNPFSDKIDFTFNKNLTYEIGIFNILGEEVYSAKVTGISYSVSTSELTRGTYLLQIKSEEGVGIKKMIKK